jgi:hypothetical protein
MPHKYQREIEEILRNMEFAEPRRGVSERVDAGVRPPARVRLRGPSMRLHLTPSELLVLAGIALALGAFCVAWYFTVPTIISGLIGLGAVAMIVAGLAIGWASAGHPLYTPSWRSGSGSSSSTSNNVIQMRRTPRGGPFSAVVTQVRLVWLKFRFMRKRDR